MHRGRAHRHQDDANPPARRKAHCRTGDGLAMEEVTRDPDTRCPRTVSLRDECARQVRRIRAIEGNPEPLLDAHTTHWDFSAAIVSSRDGRTAAGKLRG